MHVPVRTTALMLIAVLGLQWIVAPAVYGLAADGRLTAGIQAYEEARLSEAQTLLEKAAADVSVPSGDRALALVYVASIRSRRGQSRAVEEALVSAVRLSPNLSLERQRFAPGLLTTFDDVQSRETWRLGIGSAPTRVDLFVNNIFVGSTPFSGRFLPGTYAIELRPSSRYRSFSRRLSMAGGSEQDYGIVRLEETPTTPPPPPAPTGSPPRDSGPDWSDILSTLAGIALVVWLVSSATKKDKDE